MALWRELDRITIFDARIEEGGNRFGVNWRRGEQCTSHLNAEQGTAEFFSLLQDLISKMLRVGASSPGKELGVQGVDWFRP